MKIIYGLSVRTFSMWERLAFETTDPVGKLSSPLWVDFTQTVEDLYRTEEGGISLCHYLS